MSKALYIQDDFGNQIPMLDANGNLTMQVIMLYTEDKLTTTDRKAVDAFAAQDEMSRDALDGFALTGSASKTRHVLGELNNEIQKKSGAKASSALLPKEENTFNYQKLAAAVALLLVVGGGSFFIAQQFSTNELAESIPVEQEKTMEQQIDAEPLLDELMDSDSIGVVPTEQDKTIVVEKPESLTTTKKLETEAPPKPKETIVAQKEPLSNKDVASEEKNDELALEDAEVVQAVSFDTKRSAAEAEQVADQLAAGNAAYSSAETKLREEESNREEALTSALKKEKAPAMDQVPESRSEAAMTRQQNSNENQGLIQPANSSAKYPGGDLEMYKFIEGKKNYTEAMRSQGVSGTVTIKFDIETDGRLTNLVVKSSLNGLLDADALRVIRSMPTWTPAYEHNKPVRSTRSVNIKYGEKTE